MAISNRGVAVSVMGFQALTSVALVVLLLHPSLQFTLVHITRASRARAQGLPSHSDADAATSVHREQLVASDNTAVHAAESYSLSSNHHHDTAPSLPTSDSADTHSIPQPAAQLHTRPANSRKTNRGRGENFRTSHRFGETPAESLRQADAEGVSRDGSTPQLGEQHTQTVTDGSIGHPDSSSDRSLPKSPVLPPNRNPFTEVVQVKLNDTEATKRAKEFHVKADGVSRGGERKANGSAGGERSSSGGGSTNPEAAVLVAVVEQGERQALQQPLAHSTADPHVSKMVLTAIGSLTAILGVCVMAAIFQCCCRRKRDSSSSSEGVQEEGEEKKGLDQKSSGSSRSSKSPSPHKEVNKEEAEDEEEETDKGHSEQEALLDEDKDLGDFSVVQRETSILRSYRKPPPPKNRTRASRVPRALRAVEPNADASMLKELVKNEQKKLDASETSQKATGTLPSSESMSSDMQSSMLADIDSTLAAMHTAEEEPSPTRSANRSREPSAEKVLVSKTEDGDVSPSQVKSPTKPLLPTSSSREQLAKSLAQELSRSVSKEMLAKPHSKSATPKSSKETTPTSGSERASPKIVHTKDLSDSSSKDSVGSNGGAGAASSSSKPGSSPKEEEDKNKSGNIFAMIDPTTKDKGGEAGSKSKIPVRAGHSPTQPTAPLRLSTGKDKRFPVPSVHGDQMDQLMKSLKTRLKEDDGASPKPNSSTGASKNDSSHNDDLDPQSRDRSHSDPTKQQEERGVKKHQTDL
ncbi:uncharacterized protein LOC143285531 [Babylonia areolata]|uniref:uncharacterized protein LOC143285531 n=1 Tax=Babylonia areolata TaxID=304850 RepID=UPI003FCF62E8